MPTNPEEVYQGRITEQYLLWQVNGYMGQETHTDHKKRLQRFDDLYQGHMLSLFPNEDGLADEPLVENKIKNAAHDLARLASEAKGVPVFMREGEGETFQKKAALRAAIADTIWFMAKGKRMERKLYLDLISAGYVALSIFQNSSSEYPQITRLNPRLCYPDVRDGTLVNLVYVENIKERVAAQMFPDLGLNGDAKNDKEVLLTQYFDKDEAVQAICGVAGGKAKTAHVLNRWEHKLGMVPVAFRQLDSADDTFHGLFDQLGGPLMIRNKVVRLLADYLESMAHAPLEARGVLNSTDEPGPLTVYQHDDQRDDTFIRRLAPAAPAGSVFGLLQYMDAQESAEAIQPPARVGVVRQSIASGSFVDSTQGTLSSVIFELQDIMAELRTQANTIAFAIDERYLNKPKPLYRAVGKKHMYTPKEDLAGFYYHSIQYGASAGLNRAETASRVLQDMGAGLISKEMARSQIDYVDDVTVEQNRIDKEQLATVAFQRFSADPNTPMTLVFQAIIEMGKGKSFLDVITELAPEMVKKEAETKAEDASKMDMTSQEGMQERVQSGMDQAAGAGGGVPTAPISPFAPPPLNQNIVKNPQMG